MTDDPSSTPSSRHPLGHQNIYIISKHINVSKVISLLKKCLIQIFLGVDCGSDSSIGSTQQGIVDESPKEVLLPYFFYEKLFLFYSFSCWKCFCNFWKCMFRVNIIHNVRASMYRLTLTRLYPRPNLKIFMRANFLVLEMIWS